jgi:transcriptional regulator with XRE-family HTH domain
MPVCRSLGKGLWEARTNLSGKRMAELMETSRTQIDRLLNPKDHNVTLATLEKAAAVVGRQLRLELV